MVIQKFQDLSYSCALILSTRNINEKLTIKIELCDYSSGKVGPSCLSMSLEVTSTSNSMVLINKIIGRLAMTKLLMSNNAHEYVMYNFM